MYNLVIKNNEIKEDFVIENNEIKDEIKLIRHISKLRDEMPERRDFTIKRVKNIVLIQFYNANTSLIENISKMFLQREICYQLDFNRVEPSIKIDLKEFEDDEDALIDLRIMLDNMEAYGGF
jgi:hypothetical protein